MADPTTLIRKQHGVQEDRDIGLRAGPRRGTVPPDLQRAPLPAGVARGDPPVRAGGEEGPDRYPNLPIRSLNAAIRALAPDLRVPVATRAAERWEAPWLYTTSEYPADVLQSLILSWLRYRQPSPDAYRALAETYRELDLPALAWDLEWVDLLRQDRDRRRHAAKPEQLRLPAAARCPRGEDRGTAAV